MVAEGAFLEWAPVFGNLYGTGWRDARRIGRRAATCCSTSTSRGRARSAAGRRRRSRSCSCRPTSRRSRRDCGAGAARTERTGPAAGPGARRGARSTSVRLPGGQRGPGAAVEDLAAIVRAERRRASRCRPRRGVSSKRSPADGVPAARSITNVQASRRPGEQVRVRDARRPSAPSSCRSGAAARRLRSRKSTVVAQDEVAARACRRPGDRAGVSPAPETQDEEE